MRILERPPGILFYFENNPAILGLYSTENKAAILGLFSVENNSPPPVGAAICLIGICGLVENWWKCGKVEKLWKTRRPGGRFLWKTCGKLVEMWKTRAFCVENLWKTAYFVENFVENVENPYNFLEYAAANVGTSTLLPCRNKVLGGNQVLNHPKVKTNPNFPQK